MRRFADNPLISPADVKPSRPDFEVVCVFNAGCIRFEGQTLLLLRVAERPKHDKSEVVAPYLNRDDVSKGIEVLRVPADDPDLEVPDSRVFEYKGGTYLTSISHMRIARSKDGIHFTIDETPAMSPARRDEEFGIEDPRITPIDDGYAINYSAISRYGVSTGLAVTKDFKKFDRKGVIFPPDNRDVTIFPEPIHGQDVCFHRPIASMFKRADMWYAVSDNLVNWGDHRFVLGPRAGAWDAWRVGGGAVPFRTEKGWLEIYHAADAQQRYCLGAFLTDLNEPWKVIDVASKPILEPDAPYEAEGFFGNGVFSCGASVEETGRVVRTNASPRWRPACMNCSVRS